MNPPVELPDVQRHRAGHVEAEMRQPMIKLDPPARNPRMVLAPHFQWRVLGQHFAGLSELLLTGEDRPGHDQRLRPRPALGQSPAHQQLVCAEL